MSTTARYSTPAVPPRLSPRAPSAPAPVPPVLSLRASEDGHAGARLVQFAWASLAVRPSRR
jgi:hypothetical protein